MVKMVQAVFDLTSIRTAILFFIQMYDCLVIMLHCIHTYILLAPPKGTVVPFFVGTRHQVKFRGSETLAAPSSLILMVWYGTTT